MKANDLSIGWAMSQPREQREAAIDRVVTNILTHRRQARDWWSAKSNTFTRLCATEPGEAFTHGQVVKAHASVAALLIIILVASWLEGGAL